MDYVVDAILGVIASASRSWLGTLALLSPIWVAGAILVRDLWRRRRSVRAFAAAQGLQFVGTVRSDVRLPFTRIPEVRVQVLLLNLVEGRWDGLRVSVFDLARGELRDWTMILVTMDDLLQRGAATQQALAAHPEALIDAHIDVAAVTPRRILDASELPDWLSFATTIARAMARDATDAFARNAAAPASPPARRGLLT